MILNLIYLSSSAVKNIPIERCRADCIMLPGKDKKIISFLLLLCPKHNYSYDHFNCSLFYNQVIFKGLSVFYPAPVCLSKSQDSFIPLILCCKTNEMSGKLPSIWQ